MRAMKQASGHPEDSTDSSIIVKKDPYKYETTLNSTFVMGGYEESYLKSELTWFDTKDCPSGWNLTSSSLKLSSGESLLSSSFTV